MTETTTPAVTMTVRVVDRGHGLRCTGAAKVARVTIPAVCPRCGGPRGAATATSIPINGEQKTVDRWRNPCGHVDLDCEVLAEAGVHPPRTPTTTGGPRA